MELKLPEQIDVIDITMRDGLQNEEHYVPLEAKLYLADRLSAWRWAPSAMWPMCRSLRT